MLVECPVYLQDSGAELPAASSAADAPQDGRPGPKVPRGTLVLRLINIGRESAPAPSRGASQGAAGDVPGGHSRRLVVRAATTGDTLIAREVSGKVW